MTTKTSAQTVSLDRRYARALRTYCDEGDEDSLSAAYDIARSALNNGVSLSQFYELHSRAISSKSPPSALMGETFFLESLSVYDMALRGYSQTIARLSGEVEERKRVEQDLRQATFDLARQRDELDAQVGARTAELTEKYKELKFLNTQLLRTNQEQAEFTYAISHDLMSPLNTISMMLSFLEEDIGDTDTPHVTESLIAARKTSDRMHRIIKDILTYSRAIGQKQRFEKIDLNTILEEIRNDLQSDLEHCGAHLDHAKLPPISGDPVQIRILFQNLISNALKFHTPMKSPVVSIQPENSQGGRLHVSVKDNGIGINSDHFDRIFVMFQRLHTYEEFNGTGLGLALCKRIVGNHGGEIAVSSTIGVGTKFTVSLGLHDYKD